MVSLLFFFHFSVLLNFQNYEYALNFKTTKLLQIKLLPLPSGCDEEGRARGGTRCGSVAGSRPPTTMGGDWEAEA